MLSMHVVRCASNHEDDDRGHESGETALRHLARALLLLLVLQPALRRRPQSRPRPLRR
jgi:hypothetical protein